MTHISLIAQKTLAQFADFTVADALEGFRSIYQADPEFDMMKDLIDFLEAKDKKLKVSAVLKDYDSEIDAEAKRIGFCGMKDCY